MPESSDAFLAASDGLEPLSISSFAKFTGQEIMRQMAYQM